MEGLRASLHRPYVHVLGRSRARPPDLGSDRCTFETTPAAPKNESSDRSSAALDAVPSAPPSARLATPEWLDNAPSELPCHHSRTRRWTAQRRVLAISSRWIDHAVVIPVVGDCCAETGATPSSSRVRRSASGAGRGRPGGAPRMTTAGRPGPVGPTDPPCHPRRGSAAPSPRSARRPGRPRLRPRPPWHRRGRG